MSSKRRANRGSRGGIRNRTSGHNWERDCVSILKPIFPHVTTSRNESRSRDNYKIDLMNHDEYSNGMLPYEFQCKNLSKLVKYDEVLNSMPGKFPKVILHRHTERRGTRFYEIGKYAIMEMDDLIKILNQLHGKS